mgnify:CR=1 FL=1
MSDRLSGVIAAVPTPFGPDRIVDADRFVTHARWALDHGCDGLNVLGSTGEAASLAPDSRAALMRHAASELPGARMLVGTGAPDLETAIRLTSLAGECGFAGALVLPPYYYSGVSDDGLFAFFDALIRETAGKSPSIYLYNFPQMTGILFSHDLVGRLKAAHPDRLVGAKDSSGDLDYAAGLAALADFDVFPSNETSLAVAPDRGFSGTISATVNVSAPVAAQLRRTPGDGATLERARHIRETISARPLVPAVKHLVGTQLGDPAWDAVLPPFVPVSAADRSALAALHAEAKG